MRQTVEQKIEKYCLDYNIPREFLFRILSDQKVVPMIRGKASEFNAYLYLRDNLDSDEWQVFKPNPNPQQNNVDADVLITHLKTIISIRVEVKNAARGSFNTGKRTKIVRGKPQFRVKCHKSRSSLEKADTTNDRYLVSDFDLIMCNTSNCLYEKGTMEGDLQVTDDKEKLKCLYEHYGVSDKNALIRKCEDDWRIVDPADISEDNVIPRTPLVLLSDDPCWTNDWDKIQKILMRIIKRKYDEQKNK